MADRREPEAELSLKNRAMDEAPVGITISDPSREENPLVYVNASFEELTGYESEEVIGRNCRFLQGEDTDSDPVEAMRESIDAGEPVSVELRNYRKNGTEFWNRLRIAPIADDSGEIANWVGFQEDITERKVRSRELRWYERMVNTMQEAACIYDEDGRFVVVNEYLAEFYGTTRDALEGERSNLVPKVRSGEGDPYGELLAGDREEIHGEVEGEFPNRGHEVLSYRLTPLTIDGRVEGVVAVAREITEQTERQRELERKNERLEEFTRLVSHDLRNPLNVAQGHLELARSDRDSDHLETAADAVDRSLALIDDLLTLAREGSSDPETVELPELVAECWANAETAGADLVVDCERTVRAEPRRLKQLLENLFRNAVEHGSTSPQSQAPGDAVEHGGEALTVTVGGFEGGFFVADDGRGIPAEERDRVFDAGYSTNEDGTGFGLHIVKEVARAHGWEVSVTDSDAGGARFEIAVPGD